MFVNYKYTWMSLLTWIDLSKISWMQMIFLSCYGDIFGHLCYITGLLDGFPVVQVIAITCRDCDTI